MTRNPPPVNPPAEGPPMETDRSTTEWDCEAYSPEAREIGALCFVARELGSRVCASPGQCGETMTGQRQRVFRRMQELAATGDETGAYLADVITRPEQLLGGTGQRDGEPPR